VQPPSKCSDVNECTANTDNCDANAGCTNTSGSFTCKCNSGYSGDGVTCTDKDECALNTDNCNANAMCSNKAGSFSCACNNGFSGNGVTCTDKDECTLDTDNCNVNATCSNTSGSFTCACKNGYSGDGVTCTDKDECTLNTDNCDANATCSNTAGSFTCACKNGFWGTGVTCTPNPSITSFTADYSRVCGGGTATFSATFKNGTGSIDHSVGSIVSGSTAKSGAIAASTVFKLTVSAAGGTPATATVTVDTIAKGTFALTKNASGLSGPFSAIGVIKLTDGRVLVFGSPTTTGVGAAQIFDPHDESFTSTTVSAGQYPSLAALNNGRALVTTGDTTLTATVYNPASNTAVATGGVMLQPRLISPAITLSSGKVLLAGGLIYDDTSATVSLLKSSELYDPSAVANGSFSAGPDMSVGHYSGGYAFLPNAHKVLLPGGCTSYDNATGCGATTTSADLYDPTLGKAGAFLKTGAMATAHVSFSIAALADDRVLVAGGLTTAAGTIPTKAAELYDPQGGDPQNGIFGAFQATGAMGTARLGASATLLKSGSVLIAGGYSGTQALASSEVYDPLTGKFTASGNLNFARSGHGAVLLDNGMVLIGPDGTELYCQ
jgi:hypothetical protein